MLQMLAALMVSLQHLSCKGPGAIAALIRLFSGVCSHVIHESRPLREVPGAQVTLERLLTGVDAQVNSQGSPLLEDFSAVTASEPFVTVHTLVVA